MKIPIVNERDEIIEYKERDEALSQDIRRTSIIWIFNKNKEVLIQKRQLTKKIFPGRWSPSTAGTIEENETYEANATKELEEELGVKNAKLIPLQKKLYQVGEIKRFRFVFIVYADILKKDFILQKSEVAEVKWISLEKLSNLLQKTPDELTPSVRDTFDSVKSYINNFNFLKNDNKNQKT
jgi:isopentenyl-diphosphate Delta-isomerase